MRGKVLGKERQGEDGRVEEPENHVKHYAFRKSPSRSVLLRDDIANPTHRQVQYLRELGLAQAWLSYSAGKQGVFHKSFCSGKTPPGMVMVPMTGVTVTPSGMVMLLRPRVTVTPLSDEKDTPIKCRDIPQLGR